MCFFLLFYFGVRVEVEVEEFSFGVRCKLEIFSFGISIGVEDAKSLDLLHDFSLSVQTCLSFFFFFFFFFSFFAFKLMHSAHGEMQWQKLAEKKKSRYSQTHHSQYSFLERKNK